MYLLDSPASVFPQGGDNELTPILHRMAGSEVIRYMDDDSDDEHLARTNSAGSDASTAGNATSSVGNNTSTADNDTNTVGRQQTASNTDLDVRWDSTGRGNAFSLCFNTDFFTLCKVS